MPAVQRLRMVISEARQLVERCRARLHGWESLGWLPAWVPESLRGPFIMVAV